MNYPHGDQDQEMTKERLKSQGRGSATLERQ